jgi:hypothetical protein
MKMSTLRIGDGASVGDRSIVLYDAVVGSGVALEALTLVMKGEHLPAGTRWRGITAQVVTAVAEPATGDAPAGAVDPDLAEATRVLPQVDPGTTRLPTVLPAVAPASDPGRTMRMRSVHASGAFRPRRPAADPIVVVPQPRRPVGTTAAATGRMRSVDSTVRIDWDADGTLRLRRQADPSARPHIGDVPSRTPSQRGGSSGRHRSRAGGPGER